MSIAAFTLYKCTSTDAGTETDVSKHPCFLRADVASTDTASYSVAVPSTGTNYSYEMWVRLKCLVAPDNQCENFVIWGENTPPATGITIYMGTTDTGVTPVDTVSSVATTQQDTNYYDQGTGLAIGVIPSPAIIEAFDEKTDYVVLQVRVGTTASQGSLPTMHFYWGYDES